MWSLLASGHSTINNILYKYKKVTMSWEHYEPIKNTEENLRRAKHQICITLWDVGAKSAHSPEDPRPQNPGGKKVWNHVKKRLLYEDCIRFYKLI